MGKSLYGKKRIEIRRDSRGIAWWHLDYYVTSIKIKNS